MKINTFIIVPCNQKFLTNFIIDFMIKYIDDSFEPDLLRIFSKLIAWWDLECNIVREGISQKTKKNPNQSGYSKTHR